MTNSNMQDHDEAVLRNSIDTLILRRIEKTVLGRWDIPQGDDDDDSLCARELNALQAMYEQQPGLLGSDISGSVSDRGSRSCRSVPSRSNSPVTPRMSTGALKKKSKYQKMLAPPKKVNAMINGEISDLDGDDDDDNWRQDTNDFETPPACEYESFSSTNSKYWVSRLDSLPCNRETGTGGAPLLRNFLSEKSRSKMRPIRSDDPDYSPPDGKQEKQSSKKKSMRRVKSAGHCLKTKDVPTQQNCRWGEGSSSSSCIRIKKANRVATSEAKNDRWGDSCSRSYLLERRTPSAKPTNDGQKNAVWSSVPASDTKKYLQGKLKKAVLDLGIISSGRLEDPAVSVTIKPVANRQTAERRMRIKKTVSSLASSSARKDAAELSPLQAAKQHSSNTGLAKMSSLASTRIPSAPSLAHQTMNKSSSSSVTRGSRSNKTAAAGAAPTRFHDLNDGLEMSGSKRGKNISRTVSAYCMSPGNCPQRSPKSERRERRRGRMPRRSSSTTPPKLPQRTPSPSSGYKTKRVAKTASAPSLGNLL